MLTFLRRAPLVVICIFFISGILLEFEFSLSPSIPPYLTFALLAIEFLLILKKRFLFLQTLIIISASFLSGINSEEFSRTCMNPKPLIRSLTQVRSEILPTKKLGMPRAIASSAIAEDRMTCPEPIDVEASARNTNLIEDKGML